MEATTRVRPQQARREWLIVAVLIAVGFGAFSAEQWWTGLHVSSEHPSGQVSEKVPVPSHASSPAAPIDAREGHAVVDPSVAKLGTDDLGSKQPRTLVLIDSAPGRNPREGTARLGTDPRNPQTYSAGAVLLNGARLTEIYWDYIVLERNGATARLYVQGKQPRGKTPDSDLLQVGGASGAQQTVPPAGSQDAGSTAPSFTELIRPNPVFEGQVLKGFALYPGHQSGAFYQSGLSAGDVLIALNGVPASDGEQVMNLLQQWVSGAALGATVQRDGRTEHVTLDGSLLRADGMWASGRRSVEGIRE